MAEGWARHLKSDHLTPYSAGIETHGLNPNAVKVMAEVGIDITSQRSQHIDEFKDTPIDVVVTVCDHAHETCPWFPANCKVVHHSFGDPPRLAKELAAQGASEEEQMDAYRRVRDEIKAYIEGLPDSLPL
jgi:arsenate reductase